MAEHDASYKLLFSHPRLVADLLRELVAEPWVAELDLSTLARVSGAYVAEDLQGREQDLVWKVRWRDRWLYLYLLLEFQSTVDPFMAVRVLAYVALFYQGLIRAKELPPDGLLPPVLPLVVYNGKAAWSAALEIAELTHCPAPSLARFVPRLSYLVLDEARVPAEKLRAADGLAASVIRLERSRRPGDIQAAVEELLRLLVAPEDRELRRAFAIWLSRVLLPARMPGATVPGVEDLTEVRTMLAETVIEWTQEWKQEGLQEGEARMLLELLAQRFGPLDVETQHRVSAADSETLLRWAGRLLTAKTRDDVFAG